MLAVICNILGDVGVLDWVNKILTQHKVRLEALEVGREEGRACVFLLSDSWHHRCSNVFSIIAVRKLIDFSE